MSPQTTCTNASNQALAPGAPRSCFELGVCQSRTPPCAGCSHDTSALPPGGFWFAPGTIERAPAPRREPWSWLEISLAAIAASGVAGLVAGVATMWVRGLL